ncbi:hypothetical protein TraAM80_04564 [Trypanosoma rangeli]|uniref:WWE domain-containing protein n=1 Tax=Trypanosoma rangeli TaxID=5698 RepID=A0A422NIT0_TRYRA|nr:uncharacterized protein TraAM80_04564 [Trypanosoma rangeli]RNF05365.1 hypothetical protein TraAM80_04564 [Trypanosoma rangeli]|eukprot:RNF05365.1 hypothetical protein TraAM80_04564 [Trypanosoma rangeli]
MGSGGSTIFNNRIMEAEVKIKGNSKKSQLDMTDYTNKPRPTTFGRAVLIPRILSELPPPPAVAEDEGHYAWFLEDLDRPGEWVAYPAEDSERLNAAWFSGQRECLILTKMKRMCTVDLSAMVQLAAGSSARPRKVKRVVVEECGNSTVQEKHYVAADPFLEEVLDHAGRGADATDDKNDGDFNLPDKGGVGTSDDTDASRLPQLLRSVATHSKIPFTLAFSPSGRELLTSTREELLRWDVETAAVLMHYNVDSTVLASAYSADGSHIVCGGKKYIAWLFDVNSPNATLTLTGHTHRLYGTDFLAGEKRLATASMDNTVRCWDIQTGSCVLTDKCHTASVFALATSRLSDWFALSGGDDELVCAHDFRLGNNSVTARFLGHKRTIWSCAFRGDEQQFASSGIDRTLNIWDLRQPREPVQKCFGHLRPVQFAEYLPYNRGVLTCARDYSVCLTDASTGELVWRAKAHAGCVFRVRYHAETRMMATSGGDGNVNLWRYDNVDKW